MFQDMFISYIIMVFFITLCFAAHYYLKYLFNVLAGGFFDWLITYGKIIFLFSCLHFFYFFVVNMDFLYYLKQWGFWDV